MRITIRFSFLILLFIVTSCRSQNKEGSKFTRDIPDYKNGRSNDLQGLSASRDSLKLDTLENGYDSIQIRIWVTYLRIDTFQIFSIKKSANFWSGDYCEAALHFSKDHGSLLFYTKTKKSLQPKSGWPTVVDSLLKLNILTLPDCSKIKGYDFPLDGGNSISIEVSTMEKYRLYMYQLPSTYKNSNKEAADVDNILQLISNEFNIKYLAAF